MRTFGLLAFVFTLCAASPALAKDKVVTASRGAEGRVGKPAVGRGGASKPSGGKSAARVARSIGAPNAGRMEGGVELKPTAAVRFLPAYNNPHARYGMPQLVGLLERAAKHVQRRFPGSVMSLGHLSNPQGGDINRHASHETGRDADVAFYAVDAKGKPVQLPTLVHFDRLGRAQGYPGVRFDDARNFEMVAALVNDPQVRVSGLYVAPFVRARLLAYGTKIGAAADTLTRLRMVMVQPKGALLHDDHVHVRIACPDGMRECIEFAVPRRARGVVQVKVSKPSSKSKSDAKKEPKKEPKSEAKPAPRAAAPKSAPQKSAPPKPPAANAAQNNQDDDDDEPEGLDRLIGPSVRGWDSIRVPSAPLFEPADEP